ncbi:MAG: ParB/RepB/Spo0J family partition protein [Desulfobulbaceae bacterium]|nr:MAG: ParB/RepB/Spo0J family partition protein [Desulfobulbaceae bacterium]
MAKQTGLGLGASLLFGKEQEERFFQCEIDKIVPNKHQPRANFNDAEIEELSRSIREKGVIQPLIVTNSTQPGIFELVAGERRLRASKLADLQTVPVIVLDIHDEQSLLELALIENVQRTDLNPIEEAEAYYKLIDKFGYTQEETAQRVGKNRSTITNLLRLLNLPQFVKTDIIDGTLSEGHGRALLRLADDPLKIKELRDLIVNKNLSVRQTEQLARTAASVTAASKRKQATIKEDEIPASYCSTITNQLTNRLHSRINIVQNGSRGKIEIEYYSLDDLERLVNLIVND